MKCFAIMASVLMLMSISRALALLGQTEDQVNALLGKPIDAGKPDNDGVTTNMYQSPTGEYLAVVQFVNNHSVAETYARVDSHKLSEKELSTFLKGNAGGKQWKKNSRKSEWERSDHRARAWCETLSGRPTLLIQVK